jgi:hypothetical protein
MLKRIYFFVVIKLFKINIWKIIDVMFFTVLYTNNSDIFLEYNY